MTKIKYENHPNFTGRNVSIDELSVATGKSSAFLREGLKQGFLTFGFACKREGAQQYSFYCPDKLVWEQIGYFREKVEEQD